MSETPRAPAIGRTAQPQKRPAKDAGSVVSLVIGGSGSFGAGVVHELLEQGRPVRVLVRNNPAAVKQFGAYTKANFSEGNVFDLDSLRDAADGCDVLYHAVNFPLSEWEPNARVATENIIKVATEIGARIVFPGNTWVFGSHPGERLDETAEKDASAKKGRIRMELEGMLQQAAERGDCRVLVVRAGDFFGPSVRNAYHDAIFESAIKGKGMLCLGDPEAPHQWAYVPDLARVCIKLSGAMEKFSPFETFHFAGHSFEAQKEFYDTVKMFAEDPSLKIKKQSWLALRAASLANKEIRELLELRHIWDEGVLLDDGRLKRVWPRFEPTGLDKAVSSTLVSYR